MPRPQIGFTRGRVYFPIRNEDGSIAGFVGYADGQLKMPPQWIGTNVVKLNSHLASAICASGQRMVTLLRGSPYHFGKDVPESRASRRRWETVGAGCTASPRPAR